MPNEQFCGRDNHPWYKCPARNLDCLSCGKKGHFSNVCWSKSKEKLSNTKSTSAFIAVSTLSPRSSNTQCSVVDAAINNTNLEVMIDSGSTHNFIKSNVAKSLGLQIQPYSDTVRMASSSLISRTQGHSTTSILINRQEYLDVRLSILSDFCKPIILGQKFMRLHSRVEFLFNGSSPPLQICNTAHMNIEPPSLFANLSEDCRPITTKIRNYSTSDREFIRAEIQKFLKQGIIVNSNSPWRAQVLVTHNERHKRCMVIDYSTTINRFTYLDAFPLPKNQIFYASYLITGSSTN